MQRNRQARQGKARQGRQSNGNNSLPLPACYVLSFVIFIPLLHSSSRVVLFVTTRITRSLLLESSLADTDTDSRETRLLCALSCACTYMYIYVYVHSHQIACKRTKKRASLCDLAVRFSSAARIKTSPWKKRERTPRSRNLRSRFDSGRGLSYL